MAGTRAHRHRCVPGRAGTIAVVAAAGGTPDDAAALAFHHLGAAVTSAAVRLLGLDPIEVRLKNAVAEGDPLPSGQAYPRIGLVECRRAISESNLWKSRAESKQHPNRGVGLAVGGWMGGLQPASAIVSMNPDATFNVTVGAADITGVNTSFQRRDTR